MAAVRLRQTAHDTFFSLFQLIQCPAGGRWLLHLMTASAAALTALSGRAVPRAAAAGTLGGKKFDGDIIRLAVAQRQSVIPQTQSHRIP